MLKGKMLGDDVYTCVCVRAFCIVCVCVCVCVCVWILCVDGQKGTGCFVGVID